MPDDKIENAASNQKFWEQKKEYLTNRGELHVMRECHWKKKLQNMSQFPNTQMGHILEKCNEETILKGNFPVKLTVPPQL